MDSLVSRWLQIRRFTAAEIEEIHRVERAWYNGEIKPEGWHAGDWERSSRGVFKRLNSEHGPFWPESVDEKTRGDEVWEFNRRIFPVWRPRQEAAIKNDTPDIDWIHQTDLEILKRFPREPISKGKPKAASKASRVSAAAKEHWTDKED